MPELKIGSVVHLTNGATATVKKELGKGGQGTVYLVSINGKNMALKWYHKLPSQNPVKFYNNLQKNADAGAPSPLFLWPEYVTVKEYGSFGYLMNLRPEGYYEFSKFLLGKYKFSDFKAMFTAAIEICESFKALHAHGFSYQDLNAGNFFIEPKTGHLLICDNDNVFPNRENSGIKGTPKFMAPEVVMDKRRPDAYTDKFSLAVILFEIFYIDHPFVGAATLSNPCETEAVAQECYGSKIQFILDPNNQSNAPVRGLHNNVIKRWLLFPKNLRETFIREFSTEILRNPEKRMTELQWLDLLSAVRDHFVTCPFCGNTTPLDSFEVRAICKCCGKNIDISNFLTLDKRRMPLSDGNIIFLDRSSNPSLRVVHNAQNISELYIQNLTQKPIEVMTPSGKLRLVAPSEYMPVKKGLKMKVSVSGTEYKLIIE